MQLFVYGTLRRDAANHHELRDARFVGLARTAPRYELVDMGGYPALLEGGDRVVHGELYEIDDALLASLDAFEEVPDLYERKDVALDLDSKNPSTRSATVQAYVMTRQRADRAPVVPNGDWIACSH
jgi:gamma-glutamylcyclotransferase (GGCT)/AIG2-like uncharacterized protein YtfP